MLSDIQLIDSLITSSSSFADYVRESRKSPHTHTPKLVWRHEIDNQEPEYLLTNGCTFCWVGNGDCVITDDPPPHPDEEEDDEEDDEEVLAPLYQHPPPGRSATPTRGYRVARPRKIVMRKVQYVIIRHGSNAANQSCCPRAAIGTVEAKNKSEAERIANKKWTFYANQYCEVIPFSKARAEDRQIAQEEDVSGYQENQWLEEEAAYWNRVAKKKRKANAALGRNAPWVGRLCVTRTLTRPKKCLLNQSKP